MTGSRRVLSEVPELRGLALPVLRRLAVAGALLAGLGIGTGVPAAAAPSTDATAGARAATTSGAEARAGDDVAWGIRPRGEARENFRLEVRAGERIEDALIVTNHGSDRLELRVFGADGALVDDHVGLAPVDALPVALGAWLTVAPTLELEPGASVEVPFVLAIPADAAPGALAGALVTSSLAASDGDVAVDRRLAASIVVTVVPTDGAAPSPAGAESPSSIGAESPSSIGAESPSAADVEPASGDATSPPMATVLAVLALLAVAAGVWLVVLRGRANP